MAFRRDHELHVRRFGRNLGLGLTLVAFVAIVFGLTITKVTNDPLRTDRPAAPAAQAPQQSGAQP